MRGKGKNAETMGDAGLAIAFVVFGCVLVGLLTYVFWRGSIDLVLALVIAVVPVAIYLAWLWSRMR